MTFDQLAPSRSTPVAGSVHAVTGLAVAAGFWSPAVPPPAMPTSPPSTYSSSWLWPAWNTPVSRVQSPRPVAAVVWTAAVATWAPATSWAGIENTQHGHAADGLPALPEGW